ncbi:MAG: hypothetical protein KGY74_11190, partial [Candidatus Cloacimonetes bacterium]|nr:hypothetical protein [Candidatus Cloacimonadota bacterium]
VLLIDMKEINLAYTCEYEPTERREEEKRRRREDEWGEDKNLITCPPENAIRMNQIKYRDT